MLYITSLYIFYFTIWATKTRLSPCVQPWISSIGSNLYPTHTTEISPWSHNSSHIFNQREDKEKKEAKTTRKAK